MNAKATWDLWRRILREPALAERLFDPDFEAEAGRFGMTPEDVGIARAYAATPEATRFFITTYRYRLVSSFGHALQSGAPLTYRTLRAAGHEMRALGERCLNALGWRDMGPHVYGFCAEILGYLRGSELAGTVPGLPEVMAVDGATVDLMRRLAGAPASAWPARGQREAQAKALDRYRFQHTGTGAVVRTGRSLTPWLRDRSAIGKIALPEGPELYLVCLPSAEEAARLVPIGARGGAVFALLAEPRSPDELGRLAALGPDEHRLWLGKYVALGAVSGSPTDA